MWWNSYRQALTQGRVSLKQPQNVRQYAVGAFLRNLETWYGSRSRHLSTDTDTRRTWLLRLVSE